MFKIRSLLSSQFSRGSYNFFCVFFRLRVFFLVPLQAWLNSRGLCAETRHARTVPNEVHRCDDWTVATLCCTAHYSLLGAVFRVLVLSVPCVTLNVQCVTLGYIWAHHRHFLCPYYSRRRQKQIIIIILLESPKI